MVKIGDFCQTQNVSVTVLVDNRADLIVKSTDTVKRFTEQPLLAEHGFAALIELQGDGMLAGGMRILWDAGMTSTVLLENARRMEVDLSTVDAIALSHGHGDHTAAMTEVIRAIGVWPKGREWEAGATMDDLVAVRVFCPDLSLYEQFNEVYRSYFADGFPTRSFIGSGPLLRGSRFEINGIAVKR